MELLVCMQPDYDSIAAFSFQNRTIFTALQPNARLIKKSAPGPPLPKRQNRSLIISFT